MAKGSTANRSETFGRLLSGMVNSIASYEGKSTAIVEEELGAALNVAGKTVQRYKAGYLPPGDESVRMLAEAGVRRGFLGREWLQRFLHAARYPFADKLLDELCPAPQVRPRPPRVYANLPAPSYSQFVMREQAFAEVLDGLQQRSAVILIVGMGGNGKTSLAREVASHCLRDGEGVAPCFDAAVWVSDKDQTGTTNLSIVLDVIARTLDYPGFTQFEHSEKQHEVEQLLRRQRVLLIIDNFETITDGVLLAWLLRLPEPSKALVTTREYRREWRSSWPVELRGMREAEAWELMTERLRVLRIEHLVADRTPLEPLLAATGGNPKAITITLGLVKFERRSLQQVVDDLYAARGEIFTNLFEHAWALLDEAARRVLMVATFFPTSASGEALSASVDVQGFAFDRAIERLSDMALIDVQVSDLSSPPRYALHPLVRAFACMKISAYASFEQNARQKWIGFFANFVTDKTLSLENSVGLLAIAILDSIETEIETIHRVLDFCAETKEWTALIALTIAVERFWQMRGYFRVSNLYARRALGVAQVLNNCNAQVRLLCFLARDAFYQDNSVEVRLFVNQAHQLIKQIEHPDEDLLIRYHKALRYVYGIDGDIEGKYMISRQIVDLQRLPEAVTDKLLLDARADYLYFMHQNDEAEEILLSLVHDNSTVDDVRRIGQWLKLSIIATRRNRTEIANEYLQKAEEIAIHINHPGYLARIKLERALIEIARSNYEEAKKLLVIAIYELERRGSLRGLAEARQALRELEAGAASSEGVAPSGAT